MMSVIASLTYPVLAFTPNGVMPYTNFENLVRVMKHEYEMGWYDDLEILDTNGTCAVVHSARIVNEPFLAKLLGRMIEVEIQEAEKLTEYDTDSSRSRVLEFLSLYPDMYQSAGIYDDIVRRVQQATTPAEVVKAFLD